MASPPTLDKQCSKHFKYQDFVECGETWTLHAPPNLPHEPETWQAIAQLAQEILDPIVDHFGQVTITYGFCAQALAKLIKNKSRPRISPELDQHAGHELNSRGRRICSRGGIACDFFVPGHCMREVTRWIIKNLLFDRLYFYGDKSPIHVSIGPDMKQQIVIMTHSASGLLMPRVISAYNFLHPYS